MKLGKKTMTTEGDNEVTVQAGYEQSETLVRLLIDGEDVLWLNDEEAVRLGLRLQAAAQTSPMGWHPDAVEQRAKESGDE